jgi:hypothetical protein
MTNQDEAMLVAYQERREAKTRAAFTYVEATKKALHDYLDAGERADKAFHAATVNAGAPAFAGRLTLAKREA